MSLKLAQLLGQPCNFYAIALGNTRAVGVEFVIFNGNHFDRGNDPATRDSEDFGRPGTVSGAPETVSGRSRSGIAMHHISWSPEVSPDNTLGGANRERRLSCRR